MIGRFDFSNSYRVEARGFSGGIWILWNDDIWVDILTISNQFIYCVVSSAAYLTPLFVIVVYASPSISYRRLLWTNLERLNSGNGCPWLLGGDFNAILRPDERIGGAMNRVGTSNSFIDFVDGFGLSDLGFNGLSFTWSRGSLKQRLDRCLVNTCWLTEFSDSAVFHLDHLGSDHRPIFLLMKPKIHVPKNQTFRFLFAWRQHPGF
ncbi:uncharacterized protein LOC120146253 [Hibiscus syriacus]|uniref:uncharacterized protein LOC120146253 n=1 Tax=Hibiscus syriacus TaxID=106335 RepID=UPI0019247231|nr:uncharacterized protein LOC120146253 [Hibiscus syriacus]